ncbi:hypothetical protein DFS34DRAFT_655149 [Phlyctochytrium arcticum]|nr:hypothetical protein DFS34DRAFT_655149 [Phlyctochytrium arcticum]
MTRKITPLVDVWYQLVHPNGDIPPGVTPSSVTISRLSTVDVFRKAVKKDLTDEPLLTSVSHLRLMVYTKKAQVKADQDDASGSKQCLEVDVTLGSIWDDKGSLNTPEDPVFVVVPDSVHMATTTDIPNTQSLWRVFGIIRDACDDAFENISTQLTELAHNHLGYHDPSHPKPFSYSGEDLVIQVLFERRHDALKFESGVRRMTLPPWRIMVGSNLRLLQLPHVG